MKTMTEFDRMVAARCADFNAVEIGRFEVGGRERAIIRSEQPHRVWSNAESGYVLDGTKVYTDYLLVPDGRYWQLSRSKMTPEQRVKAEQDNLAQLVQDSELLPDLRRLAASYNRDTTPVGFKEARDIRFCQEGRPAWIHAMGRMRRGLITKVGRTNVEIAFTTDSNPTRVYRKTANPSKTTVLVGY